MCGIVAYIGKDTPINKLMYLMHDNDSRGGHSTGAYIDGKVYKTVDTSGNMLSMIDEHTSSLFIGHTRYATHGVKTAENTHPYVFGKYTGVHNGVLSNYGKVLKEESLDDVDVDSKAIYKMLDETDDYATLGKFSGTINAVWTESNGQLYVYRRNNPLFRLRTDDGIYFSSLKEGLIQIADNPKKVKEVSKDKLFIYSASGELIDIVEIPVTAIEEIASKNWYEYGDYKGVDVDYRTKEEKEDEHNWNRSWNERQIESRNLLGGEVEFEDEDDLYGEAWYLKMQEGLESFEKAFDEMKYHGWLLPEDISKIEFVLESQKAEVYI